MGPHAALNPNFSLEPRDTDNCDRRECRSRNREAALDRTHRKGSELQTSTLSAPSLWDRWQDAPISHPRC